MSTLPNGDLVAGGAFTSAGGVNADSIARWDGAGWSPLGSGMLGNVSALATLPNGALVAGGPFIAAGSVAANQVALWNGTGWSALGPGISAPVRALATLPNGDLVTWSGFGGAGAMHLARWDGTSWSALGPAMDSSVSAFTTLPNGDLVAGGLFTVVDNSVSAHVARLTTTCPAVAIPVGAGCTGSGGQNVLAVASLPWIGSTFRSVATGMPASGLAVGVLGLSTASIPMTAVLPQGVPGCTLLVSPDLLELYVPVAGSVTTQLAIPNSVALTGGILYQQVVPIELSGIGSITALTATNGLTLFLGTF